MGGLGYVSDVGPVTLRLGGSEIHSGFFDCSSAEWAIVGKFVRLAAGIAEGSHSFVIQCEPFPGSSASVSSRDGKVQLGHFVGFASGCYVR